MFIIQRQNVYGEYVDEQFFESALDAYVQIYRWGVIFPQTILRVLKKTFDGEVILSYHYIHDVALHNADD